MRSKLALFFSTALALSLLATTAAAQIKFSLTPQARSAGLGFKMYSEQSAGDHNSAPTGEAAKKRPWIAALETFTINIGVWAVDRYIRNVGYAHISWSSWKHNLSHSWVWCPDNFYTGFIGHPYHGSQYFNTARSLGLNFWESIPYAVVGYVTWGYFMENDPPSRNDLMMTSLGGINLGEIEYRLSSQVLDDSATGGDRIWREIVALLIDPVRGLNRIIYGDAMRTGTANLQTREPLRGGLSFSGSFVSKTSTLSSPTFSPGIDFDLTYGADSSGIMSRHPFDLFFAKGEIRYGQKKVFLNIDSYGLWLGHEFGGDGPKHVLGIFQHYDFMNNEIMHMGGMSFAAGLVSLFPLGNDFTLTTSLQLGPTLISAFKNQYVLVQDRDYNYDWGGMAKVEAWLSHPKFGTLALRFGRFQGYTVKSSAVSVGTEGHDFLTYGNVDYSLPLARNLGLRLEYGLYNLSQYFKALPSYTSRLSRVGAALEVRF